MKEPKWYEARNEIAAFALPLIKDLRIKKSGYPGALLIETGIGTEADMKWDEILKDIESALESIVSGEDLTDEEFDLRQEKLELFGKYFINLWD